MYRIILADDEGIVTDSLKYIIEKNFGDECQIAIAKNGMQAIETAESFKPDIIFLDIQMPGINGLKALEEICNQNSKIKAVILTAYDNFDYAKEALQLGAVDYLMKPINKKTIVEVLTNIMHSIDQERQKRKDDLQVREKMDAVIPIIENGLIISLITQNEYEEKGKQYTTLLELNEKNGIIMVLEWGKRNQDGSMENPVGSGVRAHKFYSQMAEMIKIYFKACVSDLMGNKIICLIPTNHDVLDYEDRLRIIDKARNMITALQNSFNVDFKAGIGSVRSLEVMYESYQEALNALRHGKWKVTHIDDLIVKDVGEKQQDNMEQMVLNAVKMGREEDARREAVVFSAWLFKNNIFKIEDIKMCFIELIFTAKRMVQSQGNEWKNGQRMIDAIYLSDDVMNIKNTFVNAIIELTKIVVIQNQRPDNGIITKSKEYIKQNFTKNLALEKVAQEADISPYYFSRLFKEEVGMNFSEYLTELRIKTAKDLLSNSSYSIKQVCMEVGYTDPNYFSRIFKKWTGITPTEFREGLH